MIGLGTGAGTKTRILLEELRKAGRLRPDRYFEGAIGKIVHAISENVSQPADSCRSLRIIFEPFELPLPRKLSSRSVVYFPGSTIGNFEPDDAGEFLSRLVELAGDDGGLLIGVDLQKDRQVIEAAYNDSAGVTAKFNKNLLARINRELGGDFDLTQWQHYAIYNSAEGRIEIFT